MANTNQVAETIIAQLGGRKIFAMAFDARRSLSNESGVTLPIARALVRSAKGRATHVTIKLNAFDTYDVETMRYPRLAVEGEVVGYTEGVHADSLRAVVEEHTGLKLSLGTMGGAK